MSGELEVPSAGSGTPRWGEREWRRLLSAATDDVAHNLWCASAWTVATDHLLQKNMETTESLDDRVEALVGAWLDESLPYNHDLASILGELIYFREIDLSWDEKVSFSGAACGYLADATWDIKSRLHMHPDAEAAVTEDLVEEFYAEWRSRFFSRVVREAEALRRTGLSIDGCTDADERLNTLDE
jgi:hypothetical protein